jgi:3-dehydroquinate synthase
MTKLKVQILKKDSSYPILIERGLLGRLDEIKEFEGYSQIGILSDHNIPDLFLDKVYKSLKKINSKVTKIIITPGETNKNLNTINEIYQKLSDISFDRKSLLVCLGGGVVGDMGGFVASTYMRGIDLVQIPTTLLAHVDSSVGGKTGFDFDNKKNLIGTFYQPKMVIIDLMVLTTLPRREFLQGYAEVLKYALICDKDFWEFLKENNNILINPKHPEFFDKVRQVIYKCCQIKSDIVTRDEEEKGGERKLLNFGHTYGHAIESYSLNTDNPLFHGEAVAIGMLYSARISKEAGLSDLEIDEIKAVIESYELPIEFNFGTNSNLSDINKKLDKLMRNDKKNINGKISWILLKKIGSAKLKQ